MTARLTITLSDDLLNALKRAKSITLALDPGGCPGPASRAAPARARNGKAGYRAGALPAKLLSWAGGRKKPFTVPEVMKALKIKRSHASMLLTYVMKGGAVRRVGRGQYRGP